LNEEEYNLVEENSLKFEQSILESEIEYNDILQESMITEFNISLSEGSVVDKFKENLINFLKKLARWFFEMIDKITTFIRDIIIISRKKIKEMIDKITGINKLKNIKNKAISKLVIPKVKNFKLFENPTKFTKKFISLVPTKSDLISKGKLEDKISGLEKFSHDLEPMDNPIEYSLKVDVQGGIGMVNDIYSKHIPVIEKVSKETISYSNENIKIIKNKIGSLKSEKDD